MSRLEDTRQAFIQSIETDYPAFDRDGAFDNSVKLELSVKEFRLAAERFAASVSECGYASMGMGIDGGAGSPRTCVDDMVSNAIDAFSWDIRGEALSFLHEAGKGEK